MTTSVLDRPSRRATRPNPKPRPVHRPVPVGRITMVPAPASRVDAMPVEEVVALLPTLPTWYLPATFTMPRALRGLRAVLDWLAGFPGDGWQQRWRASGVDDDSSLMDAIAIDGLTTPGSTRQLVVAGLDALLLGGVVRPGFSFFSSYRARAVYDELRRVSDPATFTRLEQAGVEAGMLPAHIRVGLNTIVKLVLVTGRGPAELTAGDLHHMRSDYMAKTGYPPYGGQAAWRMLHDAGIITGERHLVEDVRGGQRSAAELVDSYQIQCGPIRELLVRYLNERRPALDYGTFHQAAAILAGQFWADIERHHPGISSLDLPLNVAEAWKRRLSVYQRPGQPEQPRSDYIERLLVVRAFYLDIAQWALEDSSWVPWAVPCPIRSSETKGIYRKRQQVVARMHQRVREALPMLATLVDTAERHLAEQQAMLTAANATAEGQAFEHGGQRFRRVVTKIDEAHRRAPKLRVVNEASGERVDLARTEDHAFWAWAIIETLRHTGVRVEELTEITQLALVSYRLVDTGETVPLLQIVPSKSDEERLLLVSPELANVLAAIVSRLRNAHGGAVPLVSRYDAHERVTGPPLPHLFQRKVGWRTQVMTDGTVNNLIKATVARADLRDSAGQPLNLTPHDFRRMFATEAVTGGLPVHIAARLLGHRNLSTTQAYLAVFQDDLIRAYRAFLDQRRAVRPPAEYREPTDEEWREFQQHFELRKLELGTCGRPYGTPCKHEHACVRCPMLRVDPKQRSRLLEIVRNLSDRIDEARAHGWLGEVQGLQVSLDAARAKLVNLDRSTRAAMPDAVQLGLPIIRSKE